MNAPRRILVGLSGGSGPIMGVHLLRALRARPQLEIHLIATAAALRTLALENPEISYADVKALAHYVHDVKDIAASPASGSYPMEAMVVIPASMHTVASMAHGIADNLLLRCADVFLKERRNLIVVPRETPLHLGHLRNMATLAEYGACILPPMVAFYHHPKTVEDIIGHTVGKVLDQLRLPQDQFPPWEGPRSGLPLP